MSVTCKQKRALGGSAAIASSWYMIIPAVRRLAAHGGLCAGRGWPMSACSMADMARGSRPTAPRQTMSPRTLRLPEMWFSHQEACRLSAPNRLQLLRRNPHCLMRDRGRPMSAIRPNRAPDIFLEPFRRPRATTSPTEHSSRATNCAPAFGPSERMGRRKSGSIAVAAMRLRTPSLPCARLGSRPRFMSVRGRHGAPIHLVL